DDTLYASTITYNSGYKLNVGRKVFGPDYLGYLPYKGEIFEIIVINRKISPKEKTDIQRYLSTKWGLESKTDSDGDGIVDIHDINPTDPKKWMVMPSVLRKNSADAYTPIDDLKLWYDSTNTDGNNNLGISGGSKISVWHDLSGNSYNVSQKTTDKQPTLTTVNSKQYLNFDGSNDSLSGDFTGHILDDPTGQNVTVFTVVKPKGGLYILSTGGQAGNSKGYALSYQDYGGINSFSIFRDSSGSREMSIVDLFKVNDVHLVTHSYTGSYSKVDVLINGSSSGNNYSDSSGSSSNTHQELTIGRPPGYEDYYGNFEIAEVIAISSSDSQKINDIQYYLSSKWGLGTHVDSDKDGFVDSVEIAENSDAKNSNSTPQNIPLVVGDSQLWLDAKNVDGLKNTTISNGSQINRWVDFSGNGNDAVLSNSSYYPSLQTNQQNGLPTVYFNSDYLEFSDLTNVRSVFVVLKKANSDSWRFFLGDDNTYHFHGGSGSIFANNSWLHNNIKNGKVYQNEIDINSQTSNFTSQYELISIVTSGNVEASQIGGDRGISSQMWKGNIAEILIFTKVVTDTERHSINSYLSKKWDLKYFGDSDGDGFIDSIEISKGSDPSNSNSKPQDIPSVIAESKLWLDATNVDGKNNQSLVNGSSVTSWFDSSGNNNSAISFSGSNPVLQKNQYNSKDVVNFTSDALRSQNKIPIQSIYLVHKTKYTGYLGDFRNGINDSYLWRGHIGSYWKRYYNNGKLNSSSGSTTFNDEFQLSM
ncbi:MAG TPA: hypothetical protein QF683_21840, partial [SAR324 cluster bacterium]|nr:hypothetical protein [SAR324 cluster bacterium]